MKKKISVNVENNEVVSVEIDGVHYADPSEIADPADRARVEALLAEPDAEDEADDGFDRAFENFDEEFQKTKAEVERQTAGIPLMISGIFGLIAAICLVIAVFSAAATVRTLQKEQAAPGRVIDTFERRSYDSSTGETKRYSYPVVEFAPSGQPVRQVELSEGSWPPSYYPGDQVTVLYDPDQPNNARIQSTASNVLMWILPGITGTVGVVFAFAAILVFKLMKPQ